VELRSGDRGMLFERQLRDRLTDVPIVVDYLRKAES
jgi:hypothetical protein